MNAIARMLGAAACGLVASCATTPQKWKADLNCRASGALAAYTLPLTVRIDGRSEFVLELGTRGQPPYVFLHGFPDPDDRLQLSGDITPPGGAPSKANLEGRRDGSGFLVSGRVGSQNCTVALRLE